MSGFDMHIHSTASDGQWDYRQIIDFARKNEDLTGIAITDHDTINGLFAARDYAKAVDYPLILGIELSSEYDNKDVHILGYWLDIDAMQYDAELLKIMQAREDRCQKIISRLNALGMPLAMEQVLAQAPNAHSLGRPHVAKAMIEAGYCQNIKEAFVKWLAREKPAYVPRLKLSPLAAMDLIHRYNGVAVVAHPGVGVPDNLIPQLVRHGLGGIEVYTSEHNKMAEKKYLQMVHHFKLAATGGSDFHIEGKRQIACRITALSQLQRLAEQREKIQASQY